MGKSRHHEFLHVSEADTECATTGVTSFCVRTASAVQNAHVELHHSQAPLLLLTTVVHLLDCDGRLNECRVRLAKRDVNVPISGVNQTETRVKQAT
ncbi:hypothetical protein M0804_013344 [Polistes exclamans]|nr:hypothetical protein M0804_013344 [Polistes exclamans]